MNLWRWTKCNLWKPTYKKIPTLLESIQNKNENECELYMFNKALKLCHLGDAEEKTEYLYIYPNM